MIRLLLCCGKWLIFLTLYHNRSKLKQIFFFCLGDIKWQVIYCSRLRRPYPCNYSNRDIKFLHHGFVLVLCWFVLYFIGLQPKVRFWNSQLPVCTRLEIEHSQWQLLNSGMNYHLNWELVKQSKHSKDFSNPTSLGKRMTVKSQLFDICHCTAPLSIHIWNWRSINNHKNNNNNNNILLLYIAIRLSWSWFYLKGGWSSRRYLVLNFDLHYTK